MPTEIKPGSSGTSDADQAASVAFREVGATTGRARRAGWFDAELTRFAVQINGVAALFLTKLDVLSEFEEIKICTGYELDGKRVHYYDVDSYGLERVKPVYKTLRGWKQDIRGIRKYASLPPRARSYVEAIEKLAGVPVRWVANGPEREAVMVKR
jgi:adenylosuccinate synthase